MTKTQQYHTIDAALKAFDELGGVAMPITRADLEVWRDERAAMRALLEEIYDNCTEENYGPYGRDYFCVFCDQPGSHDIDCPMRKIEEMHLW